MNCVTVAIIVSCSIVHYKNRKVKDISVTTVNEARSLASSSMSLDKKLPKRHKHAGNINDIGTCISNLTQRR